MEFFSDVKTSWPSTLKRCIFAFATLRVTAVVAFRVRRIQIFYSRFTDSAFGSEYLKSQLASLFDLRIIFSIQNSQYFYSRFTISTLDSQILLSIHRFYFRKHEYEYNMIALFLLPTTTLNLVWPRRAHGRGWCTS